jgi:hypothetical protein
MSIFNDWYKEYCGHLDEINIEPSTFDEWFGRFEADMKFYISLNLEMNSPSVVEYRKYDRDKKLTEILKWE